MNSVNNIKTTTIIGLSKNAGKTTLLNYLIQKKQEEHVKMGLASIGVDGEKEDVITRNPKPAIKIPEGTIVATTANGLQAGTASFRILQQLHCSTVLGTIYLAEATSSGTVKLEGTPSVDRILEIMERISDYPIDEFLLDGAFDRFAGANPKIANQVYLVIGASLHHDRLLFWRTVEERVKHFFYDPLTDPEIIRRIEKIKEDSMDPFIHHEPLNHENWFYLSGIFTENMLTKLIKQNNSTTIILEHGLKSFVTSELLLKWYNMGGAIKVLHPISIAGIAVNPYSSSGYSFSVNEMKARIREILHKYTKENIEILDAWRDKKRGGVSNG